MTSHHADRSHSRQWQTRLSLSLVRRILPVGESSLHIRLLAKVLQTLEQRFLKPTLFPSLDGGHIRTLPGVSCLPKPACIWAANVLIAGSCTASPSHHCWHPWVSALCKQGHGVSQSTQHVCESFFFHYPTEEIILTSLSGANQQTHTQTKSPQCVRQLVLRSNPTEKPSLALLPKESGQQTQVWCEVKITYHLTHELFILPHKQIN